MGWLWDSTDGPEFEAVVSDWVVYDAYTDEHGIVLLDDDYGDIRIVIDGAVVDGYIYPAQVDHHGRIWIDLDGEY
ncbi:hypothetical protein [Kitasatospora sp. NPDC002965]|uniref:hypothetical protein n=1 Tax=Kitasatospora sp. NPDC002965 TaxID=3154775 RepID=UPI0033ADB82E